MLVIILGAYATITNMVLVVYWHTRGLRLEGDLAITVLTELPHFSIHFIYNIYNGHLSTNFSIAYLKATSHHKKQ